MNNKVLKNRWDTIDKNIESLMIKNNKLSKEFYQRVQRVFDMIKFKYDKINDYANIKNIAKLRIEIDILKREYKLDGYIGYELNNARSRKKLKNSELIYMLILVEYYRHYKEQEELELDLFNNIVEYTYKSSQTETAKVLKKKKPRLLTVPEAYLLQLLAMPNFEGFNWNSRKAGTTSYNAQKLYERVIVKMQEGKELDVFSDDIMKLLDKQERTYISKKKGLERGKVYEDYKSDFIGTLDNQISFLVNQVALKGMKDQGCTKVQFIAVMDSHTTDMCKSLDGQIFNIDGWNTFDRYSKEDDKNIVYKVKGLVTGANLPPINNSFHYCRSTIYPYR